MAGRKQHDVIVEGAAGRTLVAADHAAAMNEHQHRAAGGAGLRHENIDDVARIAAVLHLARDLDARIRLLLLQGRVDFAGVLRIDDAADGGDLLGDVWRHLRQRNRREREPCAQQCHDGDAPYEVLGRCCASASDVASGLIVIRHVAIRHIAMRHGLSSPAACFYCSLAQRPTDRTAGYSGSGQARAS